MSKKQEARNKADGQLGFKEFESANKEQDAGFFLIIARKKSNNEPFALARYSREDGLESEYDLNEILSEDQKQQILEMIQDYHPEAENLTTDN